MQIHTVYLGGGFGRRGGADFIGEAIEISKAAGVPVKLQWTRDDDLQHDTYRPASYTKFTSALDANGSPMVWNVRIVCPSFAGLRNGVDRTGGIRSDQPDGLPTLTDDIAGTRGPPRRAISTTISVPAQYSRVSDGIDRTVWTGPRKANKSPAAPNYIA